MASGRQFQSVIGPYSFWKKRKFKNVFICIWHAKFKLMGSPRATLRVLNQIFSGIYINKTTS